MNKKEMMIWADSHADRWVDGYPVGNGSLGAMIYGTGSEERITINEESLWAGEDYSFNRNDGWKYLKQIRQLISDNKQEEAEKLADSHFIADPAHILPYEIMATLNIKSSESLPIKEYNRKLLLSSGLFQSSTSKGEVSIKREYFAMLDPSVLVFHYEAITSGTLSLEICLEDRKGAKKEIPENNRLIMDGYAEGKKGVGFHLEALLKAEGGSIVKNGDCLSVQGADSLTIILSASTDFRTEDYLMNCKSKIETAQKQTYTDLKKIHVEKHRSLFDRVELEIPSENIDLTATNRRIERVRKGEIDSSLPVLLFHYGRYLLMASSRPGGLPANLQGLWNTDYAPPWNSDYHLNINQQMIYWAAESVNLSECGEPLYPFLRSLIEPGKKTARSHYNAGGFVVHHLTDLWGFTAPADGARFGLWPYGGAWMALHVWERYQYLGDQEFLRLNYPILKESVNFFLDYLIMGEDGKLISYPSISPENRYISMRGKQVALDANPSMDIQILKELFQSCISAGQILDDDENFLNKVETTMSAIPEIQIDDNTQGIKEWGSQVIEADSGHKHFSPLFGLYPGNLMTPDKNKALSKASETTLSRRLANGGGSTGWSRAWSIALWARLGKGDESFKGFQSLIKSMISDSLLGMHPPTSGYPDLIFQMDANLGACAALTESLLQSQDNILRFLPALPSQWPNGFVKGLVARAGFEIDISWSQGILSEVKILSRLGNDCCIKSDVPLSVTMNGAVHESKMVDDKISFKSSVNQIYTIKRKNS